MPEQQKNNANLFYFEASSMRELYDCMKSWQEESGLFFFHLNIQQESSKFCCLALVIPQVVGQIARKGEESLVLKLVNKEYRDAMQRFERKALRIIVSENNIGADVEFVTPDIAPEKILAIQSRLKKCTTATEIKAVFKEEMFR